MRYLLFWKPYDVLCQFQDDQGRLTLKDFIPVPLVYPMGRLDRDSEGLLLLSDDGPLSHRLTDPKYGHPRTYWVQVEGEPTLTQLAPLTLGIPIADYQTRPARIELLPTVNLPERPVPIRYRKNSPTTWIALTLTEGRNRQVRRMTASLGFPTLRLVRVQLGDLDLSGLSPGQWRDLTPTEVKRLHR
ncbi:pseudouridine synthase [Candidatus Cyanaurora vandensis]|uniref:pseudouridine synthase n=1 Tax=Candidatus Cyanaurora vandensis TaxID=2714958 RepID=UPI00257E9B65|nr:pseudouridine synthase [Candidatus Cyanaurora vandensis]